MRTLLASAMCPRSAISPSLTSHIAVAPSPAAAGPAWYGGSGRRWASTKARGERKPRESTANPAADQPSQPVTATTSPGCAPPRVTGSWPRRSPSAVIDTMIVSPRTTSPPTTAAPATWHSSRRPSISSVGQVTGSSAGTTRPSSSAVGTAPIAAMSARFCAAALRPTSYAVDQSRRKCRPSRRMSVLATTLRSGAATTAASSPGPTRTAGVVVSREVSSLMSPNSPNSPTVPFIVVLSPSVACVRPVASRLRPRYGRVRPSTCAVRAPRRGEPQPPRVSPRRAATRYRGVPFPHMILVAALEVPWYRRTS